VTKYYKAFYKPAADAPTDMTNAVYDTTWRTAPYSHTFTGLAAGGYIDGYMVIDDVLSTIPAVVLAPTFGAAGVPVWVNTASGSGASVPWPVGHISGDLGILVALWSADRPTPAVDAAWTFLGVYGNSTSGYRKFGIWWQRAVSGAMPTVAVIAAGSAAKGGVILTFKNALSSGVPIEVTSNAVQPAATAVVIPSGAGPTVANSLILPMFSTAQVSGQGDLRNPPNFVNADLSGLVDRVVSTPSATTDVGLYVGSGGRAAAGAMGNTLATLTAAQNVTGITLAVKPN
jgi:hypothetical protein